MKCVGCGLIFLDHGLSSDEVLALYDEDYFQGKGFDRENNMVAEWANPPLALLDRYNQWLSAIERALGNKGHILDIGCGLGVFLLQARRRGWTGLGIEVSEFAVDYARSLGNDVLCCELIEAQLPDESFDAISMIEVIEHLTQPFMYLQEVARLCRPGGVLFISTGNIGALRARFAGSAWHYIRPPGHICYFSKGTLRWALAKVGFQLLRFFPPYDDCRFYQHSRFFRLWRRLRVLFPHDRDCPSHLLGKLSCGMFQGVQWLLHGDAMDVIALKSQP